jgi:hypothetical protein
MSSIPKFLFSNTLKEPLAWKNTHLRKADIADEIRASNRSVENHSDQLAASA